MESERLTRAEREQEIRRLYRNISKRLESVKRQGFVPQESIENFARATEMINPHQIARSLHSMDERQILNLHRDLRYINSLKSSYVIGSKEYETFWQPIKEKIDPLSDSAKAKLWAMYDKIYNISPLYERFKYTIIASATEQLYSGVTDPEAFGAKIEELYNEIMRDGGFSMSDEEFTIKFNEKLYEFYSINDFFKES